MQESGKPLSYYQPEMIPKEEVLDQEKKGKQLKFGVLAKPTRGRAVGGK